MDFVQKSNLHLSLFFTEVMSEEIVFGYFKKQTIILRPLSFKKGQKWTFFKGVSSWIMCQNRSFSYRSFSQKFYQKTTFLIFGKKK